MKKNDLVVRRPCRSVRREEVRGRRYFILRTSSVINIYYKGSGVVKTEATWGPLGLGVMLRWNGLLNVPSPFFCP